MVVSTDIWDDMAGSFLNVSDATGDNRFVRSAFVSQTFTLGPFAEGVTTIGGSTGVDEQATNSRAMLTDFSLIELRNRMNW